MQYSKPLDSILKRPMNYEIWFKGKSYVVFEEKNHRPIFYITVSRGEGQGLVLEPYLYSFDPDFPENKVWNYESFSIVISQYTI